MNEQELKEATQLARELRKIISESRDFSTSSSPNELFIQGESIIGTMAFLIAPKLEWEFRYRKKIVDYIEEGDSNAKADAKARITDEYKNYKELEATYNLAEEQVKFIKKFHDDLENEYRRTN